jgi:hypothetical protein
MRHRTMARALNAASVAILIAGLVMLAAPSASGARVSPQQSPSYSSSPSASPSQSGGGGGLPLPSGSTSASPSASASSGETALPADTASPSSSVLGETIPKTGAGPAVLLLVIGTVLGIGSIALRRGLAHRA